MPSARRATFGVAIWRAVTIVPLLCFAAACSGSSSAPTTPADGADFDATARVAIRSPQAVAAGVYSIDPDLDGSWNIPAADPNRHDVQLLAVTPAVRRWFDRTFPDARLTLCPTLAPA